LSHWLAFLGRFYFDYYEPGVFLLFIFYYLFFVFSIFYFQSFFLERLTFGLELGAASTHGILDQIRRL